MRSQHKMRYSKQKHWWETTNVEPSILCSGTNFSTWNNLHPNQEGLNRSGQSLHGSHTCSSSMPSVCGLSVVLSLFPSIVSCTQISAWGRTQSNDACLPSNPSSKSLPKISQPPHLWSFISLTCSAVAIYLMEHHGIRTSIIAQLYVSLIKF